MVDDIEFDEAVPRCTVHVVLPGAGDEVLLRVVHDVDSTAGVLETEVLGRDDGDGVMLIGDKREAELAIEEVGPRLVTAAGQPEAGDGDVHGRVYGVLDQDTGHGCQCRAEAVPRNDDLLHARAREPGHNAGKQPIRRAFERLLEPVVHLDVRARSLREPRSVEGNEPENLNGSVPSCATTRL